MLIAAFLMLFGSAIYAQEENNRKVGPESYSFIEAQGGGQLTFTDAKAEKLITPVGALSFGHYFTPVVGARLHVNGWKSKGGFDDINVYYKWNYITTDADLLLNLTNMFCKSNYHAINVILIGGIGLTNEWCNTDLKNLLAAHPTEHTPLAWDKNRMSHNIRAGLRLETNTAKKFGVSLEADINSLSDRFNSKTNDHDDWMLTGMVGLVYRFGQKYKKAAPAPVIVKQVAPTPPPAPVKVVAPTPEPKKEIIPEAIHEEVFYVICKSDVNADGLTKLQKVADFMKRNPNAQVSIVGYADKNTGNPDINMKYSQKRADAAKDQLVNKYGADGSRISTSAKGDTVQPFTVNDQNRCVIIDGK